jgi:arylsulfatase A-like enzyme
MNGNGHGTFYNRGDPNQHKNTICEADDDPKRILTVTDKAISFITRQADRKNPFYLQVSYFAIHTAFQAKQETLDRYADKPDPGRKVARGIAPMLEDLDMAIGRLLDHVEMLGISDRTYVFFTSDNGGEHHHIWNEDAPEKDRNHPLRMYKQTLYEGGIRVPFIVKGPGISAGTVSREPVCGYDLLPTFYELAGGKGPFPQQLDGGSLCTLLFNGGSGHIIRPYEGLFFHRPNPKSNRIGGHSAYRTGKYKLLVFWTDDRELKRTELYDLDSDIAEESDLSERMPEKTRELQNKLIEYLNEVND